MADKKTYPKGYHFLKPFVDVDGLYYMKGVRVPEEDGKHPTTIMFNKILPKKQIYPPLPEATLDPDLKPEVKESQQATPELDELYKKVNSLTDLVIHIFRQAFLRILRRYHDKGRILFLRCQANAGQSQPTHRAYPDG